MGLGFHDITLYYNGNNHAIDLEFTKKQNIVSEIYVRLMNKYKPPKTTRISVELADDDYIVMYTGSILCVKANFDRTVFHSLEQPLDQNLMILETLHRIAIMCAEKYGWDKTIFESAYNGTLAEIS
jgi:hypothetical protein